MSFRDYEVGKKRRTVGMQSGGLLPKIPGAVTPVGEKEKEYVVNTGENQYVVPERNALSFLQEPEPQEAQYLAPPAPAPTISEVNALPSTFTERRDSFPKFTADEQLSQPPQEEKIFGLPKNKFIQLAGMTAASIAPNEWSGRLGASLADYAANEEPNALKTEAAKLELEKAQQELDGTMPLSPKEQYELNEKIGKARGEAFKTIASMPMSVSKFIEDPEAYDAYAAQIAGIAAEYGIQLSLPDLRSYDIKDPKSVRKFKDDLAEATQPFQNLKTKTSPKFEPYIGPDGKIDHFDVTKPDEVPTGYTPLKPAIGSMTADTAYANYVATGNPVYLEIYKQLKADETEKIVNKPSKTQFGEFYDPRLGGNVRLPMEEGMALGLGSKRTNVPTAPQLADFRTGALTGKIGKKKVDPFASADEFNAYTTGSTLLQTVTMRYRNKFTGKLTNDPPFKKIKEVQLPKITAYGKPYQMTMVDVRKAMYDNNKSLEEVLAEIEKRRIK